jgi:hypothetical protein
MNKRLLVIGFITGCAASAMAAAALADPPGRVGRISYVEGEVSFQPPEGDFWTLATRNYPVAPGEAFWTGDDGRVELEVGAVEAWLDNQSQLDIVDLDYGETRLSLAQGSMDIRVHRVPRGGIRIQTPAGEVRIDYVGLYRVDVGAPQDDGSYPQVELTVFDGEAGAPSPDGLIRVDAGQSALIDAGYAPQFIDIQYAAIDDWARERESRERWTERADYAPGLTGAEDLERFGEFADTSDYGQVWFPRDVPADWAPYRYGHWAYVSPWGWTWIDDQPWGFAPFHYGRWARIDDRWGWIPGRLSPEPVYAPALVAFIGGRGWNVGLGVGGGEAMGWVPLAPDEAYRPTYEVSDRYIRQVNVANVSQTTINNIVVNNAAPGAPAINRFRNAPAAVVVRADAFAHGAPVQRSAAPISPQALSNAPLMTMANRPAPTPEARAGLGARANVPQARPGAIPGVIAAAPPPPRLQAVRAAVVAQPLGAVRPPPIAGASLTPPRSRPSGERAAVLVAPAQVRGPLAQTRPSATGPNAPGSGVIGPRAPGQRIPPPVLAGTPAGRVEAPRPPAAPVPNAGTNGPAGAQAAAQAQAAARAQALAGAQAAQREAAARQRALTAQQQEQLRAEQLRAEDTREAQARAQAEAEQRRAETAQRAQAAQQQERIRADEQRAEAARQAQARAQAEAQARTQAQDQLRAQAEAQARVQAEQRAQAQAREAAAAKAKAAQPPTENAPKRRKGEPPESAPQF